MCPGTNSTVSKNKTTESKTNSNSEEFLDSDELNKLFKTVDTVSKMTSIEEIEKLQFNGTKIYKVFFCILVTFSFFR